MKASLDRARDVGSDLIDIEILGWRWCPRRVPNQSCYEYHQISSESDAMEVFVIAPYASGYSPVNETIIFGSVTCFLAMWEYKESLFIKIKSVATN